MAEVQPPPATSSASAPRRRKSNGCYENMEMIKTSVNMPSNIHINTDGRTSSRRRRKGRSSLARRVKRFALRRTWALPLALITTVLSIYGLNPTESNPVYPLLFPSYRIEPEISGEPVQYAKGRKDLLFFSFYVIVLTFTREFIMQEILRPLAKRGGILSRGKQARFMEQAYTAVYFSFTSPFGLYVMKNSPVWFFNTRGMYEGFPYRTLTADFKFYYLFQAAYWAQQAIVLVLGLENPRKDFKELVYHHIVTLALIGLSYRFHFTHIGIAVYITHDISDLFLATSKVLNYLDSSITVPFYATFIGVWIYMRHYTNLRIIYSLFTEFKTVGPYELNWETEQYKCSLSFAITSTLLIALQALNLVWLYYVLRVAYRITFYNEQKDARSDDEEEVEEENTPEAATTTKHD
ncbi:Sphingosine N-acyltransferase lac1 [Fusarium albosuccineum]|uniref:Sphingosine N-acyltransferase lac1 n=1 Tax=Fusarium albosuccineum TaxID=1237068 RepID=A0A8H4L1V3_9HYPO|nr:Sphingosine N-acyltransferase lac1 [Fusarium albosuccineum]